MIENYEIMTNNAPTYMGLYPHGGSQSNHGCHPRKTLQEASRVGKPSKKLQQLLKPNIGPA